MRGGKLPLGLGLKSAGPFRFGGTPANLPDANTQRTRTQRASGKG